VLYSKSEEKDKLHSEFAAKFVEKLDKEDPNRFLTRADILLVENGQDEAR
jgi:hypothetical protein